MLIEGTTNNTIEICLLYTSIPFFRIANPDKIIFKDE